MLYSLLFALALAGSASAQENTRFQAVPDELPTYQVLRTNEGIQVDGRLDEADWQHAAPIAFVMPWSDLEKSNRNPRRPACCGTTTTSTSSTSASIRICIQK